MSIDSKLQHFFISYTQADKAWAEWIAWTLEDAGYTTVLQAWDFRPGGDFVLDMHTAASCTKRTIAVLSEDYLSAEFTHPEWANAFARDPKGNERVLIPVLVSDCRPEGMLRTRTYQKLIGLTEEAARRALLSCLEPRGKPASRPQFPGARRSDSGTSQSPFPGGPNYPDATTRQLSEQLQEAIERRSRLGDSGQDNSAVVAEIVELKRQILFGGQLRAGAVLADGRYCLYDVIGRGGFANVWRARDTTDDDCVAIKVLHSDKASHAVSRNRFFRGAKTMHALASDGVVPVLDPRCESDGYCFFVMELIEGGNLKDAVSNSVIAASDATAVMNSLGKTLSEAHGKPERYVHRDVKPANILLGTQQNLLLSDFDLVSADDTVGGTRTGANVGSLPYASPEQLDEQQKSVDCRADIFGLAMTGVYVVYGKELPPLDAYQPEFIERLPIDESLRNTLLKATERDPQDRFQSMEEFLTALSGKQTVNGINRKRRKPRVKKNSKQPPRHTPPAGKKSKVTKAFQIFDSEFRDRGHYRNFESKRNHSYAISYEGKLYPAKKIVSLATGLPTRNFTQSEGLRKWVDEHGLTLVKLEDASIDS